MKIGIDISQIVYKGSGVARFTEGLVSSILEFDKTNNWTFFFSSYRKQLDSQIARNIQEKGHTLITWNVPPTVLSILWNDLHTSLFLPNVKDLDWFITSDWTEPNLNVKKATIIHDLVFKKYPETVHPKILKTQKKRLELVTRETSIIFADSQSTAQDLQEIFNVPQEKIVVNYPGVSVSSALNSDGITQTLAKYKLTDQFILTVGKLEPRKNLKRLIEAYMKLLQNNPDMPMLAIAGMQGWDNKLHVDTDKIILLGYVSDDELMALYQSAFAFVYPSIYEGFGYPVVEAMLHGCPVATSNTSSLAEIAANNSALLFNPEDVQDIAEKLNQLTTDENIRKTLVENGKKQASQFTWRTYYDTLLTTLKKNI